jgi:hypothetical protein
MKERRPANWKFYTLKRQAAQEKSATVTKWNLKGMVHGCKSLVATISRVE